MIDRARLGRNARAKGATWERELAKLLRPIWPSAERCLAQTRTARREGCDVEGTPYWIECKYGRKVNLVDALAQAERDSDGRPALVIARPHMRPPIVYGEATHVLGLVSGPVHPLRVTARLDEWIARRMGR